MPTKGIKKLLYRVASKVNQLIADDSHGKYGRGLASEGYNGGYRDAIYDVQAALDGDPPPMRPRWWWKEPPCPTEK